MWMRAIASRGCERDQAGLKPRSLATLAASGSLAVAIAAVVAADGLPVLGGATLSEGRATRRDEQQGSREQES